MPKFSAMPPSEFLEKWTRAMQLLDECFLLYSSACVPVFPLRASEAYNHRVMFCGSVCEDAVHGANEINRRQAGIA